MRFTEKQRDMILRTVRRAANEEPHAWSAVYDTAKEIQESANPTNECAWKVANLMAHAGRLAVGRACRDMVGDAEKLDDAQAAAVLVQVMEAAAAPTATGSHRSVSQQEEATRNAWSEVGRRLLRDLWHLDPGGQT